MSSLRFLSVHGGSVLLLLLLLLTAVCEAEYYGDSTTPSDYDSDFNTTFEYSFFSNSSVDELDKFIGGMMELDTDEEEEAEEEEVSFTTAATPRKTTERSKTGRGGSREGDLGSSASLPVCLELRKLLWTSMILVVLFSQQL